MANSYRPAYYSIHHSLTSICKSLFKSNRGRLLTLTDEQRHSEALKWQQDQFHKILHLTALHREGIVDESEVSAFRATLLESIAAAPAPNPANQESPRLTRDKLLFLQELLHSKCISSEEYHTFKRPLLQRLAILGEEISSQDIKMANPAESVVATQKTTRKEEEEEEEWSVIDLQEPTTENPSEKPKHKNPIKQLIKPHKSSNKNKEKKENIVVLISKNETKASILTSEKGKRREREGGERKGGWGLDGFKRWRKIGGHEQEEEGTAPCLDKLERSDFLFDNAANAVATDSDNVIAPCTGLLLGDNIKKELLSWIKTELSATNRNVHFSDEQVEAISTKLPVDKSDLNSYFPKAWCDRHGDTVLEVVQKELKERVTVTTTESNGNDSHNANKDWVHFDDSENFHPNLFGKANDRYINPFL